MDLGIAALQRGYAAGELTPAGVCRAIRERAARYRDHNIWIHLLDEGSQRPWLEALAGMDPGGSPLWGIPFAIKDNIDLAGVPTTAACPDFAYTPARSATVVERLLAAGAIHPFGFLAGNGPFGWNRLPYRASQKPV